MKIQHVLLWVLLLVPSVLCTKFEDYSIEYDAERSYVKIDATIFLESEVSGLDFSIFTKPNNIKVTSSHPIEYRIDENNGYKVLIDFLQPTSGRIDLVIEFKAGLTQDLGDRNIFSMAFQAPIDIDTFSLKLILPQTSQIYYQNNQPLISPKATIGTDGRRFTITWNTNLSLGDSYVTVAAFTKPQRQLSLLLILSIAAIIIALISLGLWKFFKHKSQKPIVTSMSEDEKEIFGLIKYQKGITQEELRDKTGHSKSKISKLIRNLEKMDVIKKVPYKKTNKLESKL